MIYIITYPSTTFPDPIDAIANLFPFMMFKKFSLVTFYIIE